jgi:cardiolipin synthase
VGSSNLDPLSLSLNLEANVVIRDRAFNEDLSARLDALMQHNCKLIVREELVKSTWWRKLRSYFVFHLLRRYPAWAGWLPAHTPRLAPAGAHTPKPAAAPPSEPEPVSRAKPV